MRKPTKKEIAAAIIEDEESIGAAVEDEADYIKPVTAGAAVINSYFGKERSLAVEADNAQQVGIRDSINYGVMDTMDINNAGDLAITSYHGTKCELCGPHEQEVISINGDTPGYPTYEELEADGMFHDYCMHTLEAVEMDENGEITGLMSEEEEYNRVEAIREQRLVEREVRKWEKREAAALTPETSQLAAMHKTDWENKLINLGVPGYDNPNMLNARLTEEQFNLLAGKGIIGPAADDKQAILDVISGNKPIAVLEPSLFNKALGIKEGYSSTNNIYPFLNANGDLVSVRFIDVSSGDFHRGIVFNVDTPRAVIDATIKNVESVLAHMDSPAYNVWDDIQYGRLLGYKEADIASFAQQNYGYEDTIKALREHSGVSSFDIGNEAGIRSALQLGPSGLGLADEESWSQFGASFTEEQNNTIAREIIKQQGHWLDPEVENIGKVSGQGEPIIPSVSITSRGKLEIDAEGNMWLTRPAERLDRLIFVGENIDARLYGIDSYNAAAGERAGERVLLLGEHITDTFNEKLIREEIDDMMETLQANPGARDSIPIMQARLTLASILTGRYDEYSLHTGFTFSNRLEGVIRHEMGHVLMQTHIPDFNAILKSPRFAGMDTYKVAKIAGANLSVRSRDSFDETVAESYALYSSNKHLDAIDPDILAVFRRLTDYGY